MMKKATYLLAMFLLVFVVFCNQNRGTGLMKTIKRPAVVFIGIDGSGSYNFFEKGKRQIRRLIQFTPPGSYFFIRLISSDSYGDNNSIVTKQVPLDLSNDDNPFNLMEKKKKKIFQRQIENAKREILTRVLESEYPGSNYTDIYGFIVYVQEKIKELENDGKDIYMIVLSDLVNNRNQFKDELINNSLAGVNVYLCVYQQTTPSNKIKWRKLFKTLGVPAVKFYGADQDIPDIFQKHEISLVNQVKKGG